MSKKLPNRCNRKRWPPNDKGDKNIYVIPSGVRPTEGRANGVEESSREFARIAHLNSCHLIVKNYYVYIMASKRLVLYIGVTNDLLRRIYEHKHGIYEGFTKKYNVDRLMYFELFDRIEDAIAREKQLKNWGREKKLRLIKMQNPELKEIIFE